MSLTKKDVKALQNSCRKIAVFGLWFGGVGLIIFFLLGCVSIYLSSKFSSLSYLELLLLDIELNKMYPGNIVKALERLHLGIIQSGMAVAMGIIYCGGFQIHKRNKRILKFLEENSLLKPQK